MADGLVNLIQETLDELQHKYPEAMLLSYTWGRNPEFSWQFNTLYSAHRHRIFRKLVDLNDIELLQLVQTMPEFINLVEQQHAKILKERPKQEARKRNALQALKDLLTKLRG